MIRNALFTIIALTVYGTNGISGRNFSRLPLWPLCHAMSVLIILCVAYKWRHINVQVHVWLHVLYRFAYVSSYLCICLYLCVYAPVLSSVCVCDVEYACLCVITAYVSLFPCVCVGRRGELPRWSIYPIVCLHVSHILLVCLPVSLFVSLSFYVSVHQSVCRSPSVFLCQSLYLFASPQNRVHCSSQAK